MRGHIRARGSDGKTWAVEIDTGRGPDGKRRQRCVTVHGTKNAAETKLTELLSQLDTSSYVEPAKMSVGEYLKRWLDEYARSTVSPKTSQLVNVVVRQLHQ